MLRLLVNENMSNSEQGLFIDGPLHNVTNNILDFTITL